MSILSPFDNKEYAEQNLRVLNSLIDYNGISIDLYRTAIDIDDPNYNFYQRTIDKRRHYKDKETVKAIFDFPHNRPRLTNQKGLFTENPGAIKAYFKTTDKINLGDIVAFNYTLIKDLVEVENNAEQEIYFEVSEIQDYGYRHTCQVEYKLVLARTRNIKEKIINHQFGGPVGGGSQFGGGG